MNTFTHRVQEWRRDAPVRQARNAKLPFGKKLRDKTIGLLALLFVVAVCVGVLALLVVIAIHMWKVAIAFAIFAMIVMAISSAHNS